MGERYRQTRRKPRVRQEERIADQIVRGKVPDVEFRIIIDVDREGNPIYASADSLVDAAMRAPVRSRTRPRARFGSR